MAVSRKEARPDRLPRANPPIKVLTENGFSILRLSEIDPAVIDRPDDCRFLVEHDSGGEREVRVSFDENLIARLRIRRRIPLVESSVFWLVCAESCLATYLWEKNEFPPDGGLKISELSPEELMLALHWRDTE